MNLCYNKSNSWENMLKGIADKNDVEFCNCNPFPLEFEGLVNQILAKRIDPSDKIYDELKKKVAEQLVSQTLRKDDLHKMYVSLPVNHILTTNYDYILERAYENDFNRPSKTSGEETKYSLHRKIELDRKCFHHIHGEAKYPSTLCLGYEHYVGYLTKMREYLRAEQKVSKRFDGNAVTLRPPKINKDGKTEQEKPSWLNLFFTHDVYIVGLGLAPCEIDLWWLLTYRAYLYHTNDSGLRNIMKNRIVIYNSKYKYKNLLENLHVKCKDVEVKDGDYLSAYETIHQMIEKSIEKRGEQDEN